MQLAKQVTIRDIQDFFSKVGQVRDVRLISDRNSRRSKGIGYVEFTDASAVTLVSLIFCNSFQYSFFFFEILTFFSKRVILEFHMTLRFNSSKKQ